MADRESGTQGKPTEMTPWFDAMEEGVVITLCELGFILKPCILYWKIVYVNLIYVIRLQSLCQCLFYL